MIKYKEMISSNFKIKADFIYVFFTLFKVSLSFLEVNVCIRNLEFQV